MFEQPSSENHEQEEAQDLSRVLERLRGTGIFDTDYLASVKLVLYGKQATRVFERGQVRPSDRASFGMSDFLMGRRTDFVGIHPRAEFEAVDYSKIPDRKALPLLFVEGRLIFEQMVAHELAHNIFDIRYQQAYGPYTVHDGVTDVSDEYRARMKQQLSALLVQTWPEVDPDRFTWTRQQITEVFAFLTEREACRRLGVNETMQATVTEKVTQFVKEPDVVLERFNTAQGRQCVLSDMYAENHVLSILLAPAIEGKWPDFEQRMGQFFTKDNE